MARAGERIHTLAQRLERAWGPRLARLPIRRLMLAAIVAGVVWRIARYLLNFPLWGDEAFVAVEFIDRAPTFHPTFAGLFEPTHYRQIVPLGFMWLTLAISRVAGWSEYALRLAPLIAGLAVLPLLWRFLAPLVGRRSALLAVAVLAASYYPARHATEVKPYSTDLLVALMLYFCGWLVYERPRSALRVGGLLVLAAAAPWLSYPSAFVGGAVGLLLTMRAFGRQPRQSDAALAPVSRGAALAAWAAYGVVLCGSFGAMYVSYGGPHARAAATEGLNDIEMWRQAFPPLAEFWKLPAWLVSIHTGNLVAYPVGGPRGLSAASAVLIAIGAIRWYRRRRALLLLMLSPLLFMFAAAALQKYPYGSTVRTSICMAPSFCALLAVGLRAVCEWVAARVGTRSLGGADTALRIALLGLLVLPIAGLARDAVSPHKKSADRRCRRVLSELARKTGPHDAWFVYAALDKKDGARAPWIGPWKGDAARFIYYTLRLAPRAPHWAAAAEDVAAPNGSAWLLVYRGEKYASVFPAADFVRYRGEVEARLGPPIRVAESVWERVRDREGKEHALEVFEVLQFGGAAGASGGGG